MKTTKSTVAALAATIALALATGCANTVEKGADEFHTSGSRDADQRAEQRMSKMEQLRGEGEGAAVADTKRTLYARLGGEAGIQRIVDDFVDRAVVDPRVNWSRKGVKKGGVLGVGGSSAEWDPRPEKVGVVKAHFIQFIAVATGGPSRYDGRDMKAAHEGMKITNAEFDAVVGDLKASLDSLQVPVSEQKELLSVMESARPQIAEVR